MAQTSSRNLYEVIKEKYNFILADLGKEKSVKINNIKEAVKELDKDLNDLNDDLLRMRVGKEREANDDIKVFYEKLLTMYSKYADELESFITKLFEGKEQKATRQMLQTIEIEAGVDDEIGETKLIQDKPLPPPIVPSETIKIPTPTKEINLTRKELEEAITRVWGAMPAEDRTYSSVYRKLKNIHIKTSKMRVYRYMKKLGLRSIGEFDKKEDDTTKDTQKA